MTGTSNFNGEVAGFIYKTFFENVGAVKAGFAQLRTDIRYKEYLPLLKTDEFPASAYETTPTGATTTTTYSENSVEPAANMVYEEFDPKPWQKMIKKWASQGTLTELQMNSAFMSEIVALKKDATNRQSDFLFWQGTETHANVKLRTMEGIFPRAIVNVDVIDVVTQGVLTEVNAVSIVKATFNTVPIHLQSNPNLVIGMNANDFNILQDANDALKETTVGILGQTVNDMFRNKRIIPFEGIPASHLCATIGTNGDAANLVLAMFFNLEDEIASLKVDEVAANSKLHFLRYDWMQDGNAKDWSNFILYQPI